MILYYIKKQFNSIIKPHTPIHDNIKSLLSNIGLVERPVFSSNNYLEWIKKNENFKLPNSVTYEGDKIVSIVILCWNTHYRYLNQLMDSLKSQTMQDGWEVIIVDVSDDKDRSLYIKNQSSLVPQSVYLKTNNVDISSNTNFGISKSKGKFIAFVDHDDVLSPNAMEEVIKTINKRDVDILYSDEDKISDDGNIRHSPFFKPGWSPNMFTFTNYINHLTVIRKSLIDKVGGLDPGMHGSQDYDLLLRVIANNKHINIFHLPFILYHWREAEGSTAVNHNNKLYAFEAGKRALDKYFKTLRRKVKVYHIRDTPGFYCSQPEGSSKYTIRIVSPVKKINKQELLLRTTTRHNIIFLESGNADFELIIDTNALPADNLWLDILVDVFNFGGIKSVSPQLIKNGTVVFPSLEILNTRSLPLHLDSPSKHTHTPYGGLSWVYNFKSIESPVTLTRLNNSRDKGHLIWPFVQFESSE